ncbi:MAG: thioredoxin family protein [Saprospiraceae bacterium]|nr:thioredoxin family protein [Saprospiraceae bacterium]
MRKFFGILSLVFLASFVTAQDAIDYPAHNPGWEVDLNKAFEISEKTGKPILANFTGSDWCGWCIRLTNSVFSKPDFKTWAADNVVLLELDFPRRKRLPSALAKQNTQLQQALKIRGYPTVYLMDIDKDANGGFKINALGKTGYRKTVEQFTTEVEAMMK